jgi:hypothetical protein
MLISSSDTPTHTCVVKAGVAGADDDAAGLVVAAANGGVGAVVDGDTGVAVVDDGLSPPSPPPPSSPPPAPPAASDDDTCAGGAVCDDAGVQHQRYANSSAIVHASVPSNEADTAASMMDWASGKWRPSFMDVREADK